MDRLTQQISLGLGLGPGTQHLRTLEAHLPRDLHIPNLILPRSAVGIRGSHLRHYKTIWNHRRPLLQNRGAGDPLSRWQQRPPALSSHQLKERIQRRPHNPHPLALVPMDVRSTATLHHFRHTPRTRYPEQETRAEEIATPATSPEERARNELHVRDKQHPHLRRGRELDSWRLYFASHECCAVSAMAYSCEGGESEYGSCVGRRDS